MIKNFYETNHYGPDNTKFGGILYPSDFNTNHACGNIAARIANDARFDAHCSKNEGGDKN